MAEERRDDRKDRDRSGHGDRKHQSRGRSGSQGSRDGARGGSGARKGGYRKRNDADRSRDGRAGNRDRADNRERGGREQREENSARLVPARPQELRAVRAEHEDPIIPEGVTERDLDGKARMELKTLSKENAEFVAKHLAMAAILIESDPQLAHQHALSASRRGGRIALVRESLAITAYTIGDYALALRELRTYRRISGKNDQLPLMVDCERGLGRPDRALELARSVDKNTLPVGQQVQLAIAMSGARLDQGQAELARAELEIPQLDRTRAFDYSPALFTAYATVLEDLGQSDEAKGWHAAAERAAAALDAVSHNEFETIEIISEAIEAANDEEESVPPVQHQVQSEYDEILAEIEDAPEPDAPSD